MEYWLDRPLSFSEIIKLTFLIIKKNFIKLFLLVLLLTGPFYFVITIIFGKFSLYAITIGTVEFNNSIYNMRYMGVDLSNFDSLETYILITGIMLLEVVAIPLAIASIIILVGGLKEGKEITFGQIIKRALLRYWALFRGNISYFFFIVLILFFFGLLPLIIAMNEKISFIYFLIAVLAILVLPTVTYLMTKMSFYFAITVFEKGVMGIRRSWELVQGEFNRLLGLYSAILVMDIIVIWVFQMVFELTFGVGTVAILLDKLIFILLLVINVVYYTVIYFDIHLRANKEVIISQ